MAVYKDKDRGTYYVKTYYTDWQGQKKQKLKRGFKLQREAKEWERLFLDQFAKSPDITFLALYEKYKAYTTPRIKESTASTRFVTLEKYVLPFFQKRIVSEITPADIAAWQQYMLEQGLSETYTHMTNRLLSIMFNYAVDYLGLSKNPCKHAIGSTKAKNVDYWTPEEYKQFIGVLSNDILFYTLFEVLYYTGLRIGELLALTLHDIDFKNKSLTVSKTYYQITGKELINTPKTEKSNRTISIPGFLVEEIKEYVAHLYKPDPEERLFQTNAQTVRRRLKAAAESVGVKPIRVHDLRHSHASLLINLGANPLLVAERLGHESPEITLKTYSHLFPSTQVDIVEKMEKQRF